MSLLEAKQQNQVTQSMCKKTIRESNKKNIKKLNRDERSCSAEFMKTQCLNGVDFTPCRNHCIEK